MADNSKIYTRKPTGNSKFDISMRTRELHQLEELLKSIYLLSTKERKAWVSENGPFLSQAFDQLITDTTHTLQDLPLDDETLELSKELVITLRETGELMEGLMAKGQRLQS